MTNEKTSFNCSRNEEQTCAIAHVQSPWLTKNQARQYLQIDIHELTRLIYTGKIRSVKRGKRTIFIHTAWLDQYMMSLPSGAKVPEALQGV